MNLKNIIISVLRIAIVTGVGLSLAVIPTPHIVKAVSPIIVTLTTFPDDPSDGQCDIWEALQAIYQANNGGNPTYGNCTANVGANVIQFNVSGAIKMPPPAGYGLSGRTDLPYVHGDTTIQGPVTFDGDSNERDTHIFRVAGDAKLTLINVTLEKGLSSGAGSVIYSDQFASIDLINSTIQDNVAESDGGAIIANGPMNIIGSTFSNNWTRTGNGGAIAYSGADAMQINTSTFSNNTAGGDGGAIRIAGSTVVTVTDTKFDTNKGSSGAIFLDNNNFLTLQRVELTANSAITESGGALYSNSGSNATIIDSQFTLNTAAQGYGGAIYNMGVITVSRSSFIQNSAIISDGGALANNNNGIVQLGNVTFNGNSADNHNGGAIYNFNSSFGVDSTIMISNVTFADNSSASSGAIFNAPGQAIFAANTIFHKKSGGSPNCNVHITSHNNNLDSDGTCGLTLGSDHPNVDAQLLPPGLNGGNLAVLLTQNPNYGSPAIDAGSNTVCASPLIDNQDETGGVRPQNGTNSNGAPACDIGAMEAATAKPIYNSTPLPPGPINFGNVVQNTSIPGSLTVQNPGNYTLTLSSPSNTNGTDFTVDTSGFPVKIGAGSQSQINMTCKPGSIGPKSSTFSFSTNDSTKPQVSFTLLCNGVSTPVPTFSPYPLPGPVEFAGATLGKTTTNTIVITNTATGPVTLIITPTGLTGDPDFTYTVALPIHLTPNTAATIYVICKPLLLGLRSAVLHLSTNDPSQSTVTYPLNCLSAAPASPYLVYGYGIMAGGFAGFTSDLSSPNGVAVSPDGNFAYTAGSSAKGGRIAVAQKNPVLGFLGNQALGDSRADLSSPDGLAVSPDGNFLFATSYSNNALVTYHRNLATGAITYLSTLTHAGMANAYGVTFSPDNQYAYVNAYGDGDIVVFKQTSGVWGYSSLINATSYTTKTLNAATSVTVSPDGRNVYVTALNAGIFDGDLAVYSRNTATGALTPLQTRFQGDMLDGSSLDGLQGANDIKVSPDGLNVYVASWYSNALVSFRRDPFTGKLTWLNTLNNSGGVTGLGHAAGVAISPDGMHVYVTGQSDNALDVFNRDPSTGALTFNESHVTNAGASQFLTGATRVAASPDGLWVFVTASQDNTLATFYKANPAPALVSLLPGSATVGSNGFTLKINGSSFVSTSLVIWNTTVAATTFVNNGVLSAIIPSSWLTVTGFAWINVYNPAPGGGFAYYPLLFFVTSNGAIPVPGIDHLTPGATKAGNPKLKVDIYGANFQNTSVALIDNITYTTGYIDSTHVTVTLQTTDMAQPGTVNVKVRNLPNIDSNEAGLTVAPPGTNVKPDIFTLSPPWVFSFGPASPQFTIVITGVNFVDGATAQWNGSDRPTQFMDSTHVKVTINGADIIAPGVAAIAVTNPAPGGGSSNLLAFTISKRHLLFVPYLRR